MAGNSLRLNTIWDLDAGYWGLNMNQARGHDVSSCDVRQSLNRFLANDSGFLSAVWASVQNSASGGTAAACVKLGPNQLLQVTENLRDIDGKFQSFRELFQQGGEYLFVLSLSTSSREVRGHRGAMATW